MEFKQTFKSIMAIASLAFAMTACTNNEEPALESNNFSYELTQVETSDHPDKEASEMGNINSAYGAALAIEDGGFTLKGDQSSCKATIKSKAEKIEASFIGFEWNGTYKVEIKNIANESIVYSYTYKGTVENLRHPDLN